MILTIPNRHDPAKTLQLFDRYTKTALNTIQDAVSDTAVSSDGTWYAANPPQAFADAKKAAAYVNRAYYLGYIDDDSGNNTYDALDQIKEAITVLAPWKTTTWPGLKAEKDYVAALRQANEALQDATVLLRQARTVVC